MKELMIMAFVLTAPAPSNATDESSAYQAVANASYKQSGLENMINIYVQHQLKTVPQELQTVVANTYLIGKTLSDRKVTVNWTF